MENTKQQLENEEAERHMNTLNEKADVAKARAKEIVSDVKLGAVNLADKVSHKVEDLKENALDAWENVKDQSGKIGEKIGDKYDAFKAKAKVH